MSFHQKSIVRNQRGQGLIEYLIIVALMGVATIAIIRVMGQTVTARFSESVMALQGEKKKFDAGTVEESFTKKKDMSDFLNGVGKGSRGGSQ